MDIYRTEYYANYNRKSVRHGRDWLSGGQYTSGNRASRATGTTRHKIQDKAMRGNHKDCTAV